MYAGSELRSPEMMVNETFDCNFSYQKKRRILKKKKNVMHYKLLVGVKRADIELKANACNVTNFCLNFKKSNMIFK